MTAILDDVENTAPPDCENAAAAAPDPYWTSQMCASAFCDVMDRIIIFENVLVSIWPTRDSVSAFLIVETKDPARPESEQVTHTFRTWQSFQAWANPIIEAYLFQPGRPSGP